MLGIWEKVGWWWRTLEWNAAPDAGGGGGGNAGGDTEREKEGEPRQIMFPNLDRPLAVCGVETLDFWSLDILSEKILFFFDK